MSIEVDGYKNKKINCIVWYLEEWMGMKNLNDDYLWEFGIFKRKVLLV